MIQVERKPAPAEFLAFAKLGLRRAEVFFGKSKRSRAQHVFDYDAVYPERDKVWIATILHEQFSGKCAFCESRIETASGKNIEWFRPKAGVGEASGAFLGDHYWVQAFAWENLYLVCAFCNRSKGSRFPVEGKRAPASADRAALASERPILIDPCLEDPRPYLVFTKDGRVAGTPGVSAVKDRGHRTIEVLGLNRSELVARRRAVAVAFESAIKSGSNEAVDGMMGLREPYLAMKHALLAARSKDERARVKRSVHSQSTFDDKRESASAATPKAREQLRERARFIERVQIDNIGSIEHLVLDLSASKSNKAPCFAILGENSVGKSTILKCIALALAGPTQAAAAKVKAKDLIRAGKDEGSVTIRVSGFLEPVRVVMSRKTGKFKYSEDRPRSLTLAYGSSRLLPTESRRPARAFDRKAYAKIANLFQPFLPLTDIAHWLQRVPKTNFDDAAQTLKSLLATDRDASIVRSSRAGGLVKVKVGSDPPLPFSALSDGYQSMLGLAADIMEVMYRTGSESMRTAQGVVLIDELGNHLHPRWRMSIVARLRAAFPQVQFIYSTHDPLCLRGLEDGEVAVLQRDGLEKVYALENLPSIRGMRVEQLLTSEHFGLQSAFDPETDAKIKRYRDLNSSNKQLSPEESAELQTLKEWLTRTELLGRTEVERLAIAAAAKELDRPVVAQGGRLDATKLRKDRVEDVAQALRAAMSAAVLQPVAPEPVAPAAG